MLCRGHIEKGVVVLDEPVTLTEGTRVIIEAVQTERHAENRTPLRGTPYRFDDPLAPAAPIEDWNAWQ